MSKSNHWLELVHVDEHGRESRQPLTVQDGEIVPAHECAQCGGFDTNLILSQEDGGGFGGSWECYTCGA